MTEPDRSASRLPGMELEYSFGTGAADPVAWSTPADFDLGGPGGLDAVALDFDGDGFRDDAMWDSDGDSLADIAALDCDDDGRIERFFADPGGRGVWAQELPDRAAVVAPDHHGSAEKSFIATNVGEKVREVAVDVDHDGQVDGTLIDFAGRAGYDAFLVSPTLAVVDRDGDGRLDAVSRAGDPDFVG